MYASDRQKKSKDCKKAVLISRSRRVPWCVCQPLSHVRLFATPQTVARQAPLSMGFSRQEYWSGLPFPSPGIFLTQGSNPGLPHCGQILYQMSHPGSPSYTNVNGQTVTFVKVPAERLQGFFYLLVLKLCIYLLFWAASGLSCSLWASL